MSADLHTLRRSLDTIRDGLRSEANRIARLAADVDDALGIVTVLLGEAAVAAASAGPGPDLVSGSGPVELSQVRDPSGARRIIRTGDLFDVKPSRPGKHDGWTGNIKRIRSTPAGVEVEVTCPGQCARTIPIGRLGARKAPAR